MHHDSCQRKRFPFLCDVDSNTLFSWLGARIFMGTCLLGGGEDWVNCYVIFSDEKPNKGTKEKIVTSLFVKLR